MAKSGTVNSSLTLSLRPLCEADMMGVARRSSANQTGLLCHLVQSTFVKVGIGPGHATMAECRCSSFRDSGQRND
jgi:hypothetical protein